MDLLEFDLFVQFQISTHRSIKIFPANMRAKSRQEWLSLNPGTDGSGCLKFREISEALSIVVPCSAEIPIARGDRIALSMGPQEIGTPGRTYRSCWSFGLPPTLQVHGARVSFIPWLRFIGLSPCLSPRMSFLLLITRNNAGDAMSERMAIPIAIRNVSDIRI